MGFKTWSTRVLPLAFGLCLGHIMTAFVRDLVRGNNGRTVGGSVFIMKSVGAVFCKVSKRPVCSWHELVQVPIAVTSWCRWQWSKHLLKYIEDVYLRLQQFVPWWEVRTQADWRCKETRDNWITEAWWIRLFSYRSDSLQFNLGPDVHSSPCEAKPVGSTWFIEKS